MGQVQGVVAVASASHDQAPTQHSSSLDSVIAEAAAYGNDEMGQVQGVVAVASASHDQAPTQHSSSLDSVIAEAAAYGNDENQSLDAQAQKALECPCVAELRNGSCGVQFTEAFLCFLKSTAEEKGSDCVHPFVALQNCIKGNPEAFPKNIIEEKEVKKEEEPTQEYIIYPPIWFKESQSPKPKL